MIKTARAQALIAEHAELRKSAFRATEPAVQALFREAEANLRSCKTAAEASAFHPDLLRHFAEP